MKKVRIGRQRKRLFLQLGAVLVLDLLISFLSLGFFHSNGFRFYASVFCDQLGYLHSGFDFYRCGIEFVALALARSVSILLGIAVFKRRWCVNVVHQVLLILFILSISFSLLKILCFAETKDTLYFYGIWLEVMWTICVCSFFSLFLQRIGRLFEDEYILVKTQPSMAAKTEHKQSADFESHSTSSATSQDSSITQILRLLSYVRYNGRYFTAGSVFLVIYTSCRIFLPWFTGQVIAQIVHKESYTNSTFYRLVFSMLASLFGGLKGSCFSYATALVDRSIRHDLFHSIVQQEIAFFDRAQTGEILSRLSADCQLVSTIISTNISIFFRSLLMMIGSLIFMAILSWRLTLVTFIVIPPLGFLVKLYGAFYDRLGERTQQATAKANQVAEEVVGSIRTVRSFACEDKEIARFEEQLAKTLKVIQLKAVAEVGFSWINDLVEHAVLLTVLFYAAHLAMRGMMTVNQITSFLLYQLQMGEVFYYMKVVIASIMEGVGASRKVFEYMHRKPEISYNGAVKKAIKGQVDLSNVTFSYLSRPNQNVLEDITLQITPGQTAAIVGPSGSGKSTIVALLEHFYKCTKGKVMLDGTIIQQYSHSYYHREVALVPQDPVLYSGTIRYNILYGCEEGSVSEEQMIGTAKLANCHEFISDLKDGYETLCGERGAQMSGGQRQRIAICRALVMNPQVLILDEATSALDTLSEMLIQESLQKCSANRTVIIVAHRLSTIKNADVIFVISKGQLIQSGTHKSLSQEEGLYKSLVQRQVLEQDP